MSSATTGGSSAVKGLTNGAAAWVAGLFITFVVGVLGLSFGLSFLINVAPVVGTIAGYFSLHLSALNSVSIVFVLLPAGLLVASGYHVAANSPGPGFVQGASVAIGYFAAALLSVGILVVVGVGNSSGQSSAVSTETVLSLAVDLVVAGLLFPVAFGGLGGVLGSSD